MIEIGIDEFVELVDAELAALPYEMTRGLDNVVFMVEDQDEDDPDLLGSYEGLALTERQDYSGALPDRIVLFRRPLTGLCADLSELRKEIRITLIHEIAHFYGIQEDRLHDLGWG